MINDVRTMTEEQRNEVFLQSQSIRETTFREWLDGKDIVAPDADTLSQMSANITQNQRDVAQLKTHNHDDIYSKKDHNHNTEYAVKNHNHDSTYALAEHNHDTEYATKNHSHGTTYATLNHNHDDVYASNTHNHDSQYSTKNHNHDTQYASKSNEHTHQNKATLDAITSAKINEWDNKSTFSGNYKDLTNKPTIPSIDGLATEIYVDDSINRVTNPVYINVLSFGVQEGENVDVVENTARFQEAINYCKNDKVLVFPSGKFVFNSVDLGTKNNITIVGASSPFASFAQKDIHTGAFIDNFTKIYCNAPKGEVFFKHKSCVLILDKIGFYNTVKKEDGTFSNTEAKTCIFMEHSRSDGANKNTEKGKAFLTDCGFYGWKVCFGSNFTFDHLEQEYGTGLVADDYEYYKQSCTLASRCRFTRNGVAINQPVDARIIDCSFNKNDYAIVLRENSGFTTISNCRIEWNIHNGIYSEKAHEVTISDCEFDCNGKAGLYAVENVNSNFQHSTYRRNGAKIQTQDDNSHRLDYINNVHIYAKGNVNCNFIGNNTAVKPISDVGSAPERPSNCSYFLNNDNCIISLNNLLGCTKKVATEANKVENNSNSIIVNNIGITNN